MSWENEIEELRRREALTEAMGGFDKVARQHEFGKLTIRERLEAITDKQTFHEIGKLAGAASEFYLRHSRNRWPAGGGVW